MSIPGDQTLVVKGVPDARRDDFRDAVWKAQLCVAKNNPKFDRDQFGPHLLMYANYSSRAACAEAERRMQSWLEKRKWDASDIHVFVKQKGYQCRYKCLCRPSNGTEGAALAEKPLNRLDNVPAPASPPRRDKTDAEQHDVLTRSDPDRDGWKTRLCNYHAQGKCTKARKDCFFAHGEKDMQQYKTSLCSYDQQGKCERGGECTFAHGKSDLIRRCKFHFEYKHGCAAGDKCPYSHVKGSKSACLEDSAKHDEERVSRLAPDAMQEADQGVLETEQLTEEQLQELLDLEEEVLRI